MAVGALSTLGLRPESGRTDAREGRAEARRPELAAWLSALSFAGLGRPVAARPDWEREAGDAARSWLRLVDDGRQSASWTSAAPLLRQEVGPAEWDAALRAARAPLGRCFWRRLQSCATVEGPAGDLRGPYIVLRFESVFERGRRATETVTAMRGPDGGWRVAAYFIG